MFSVVRFKPEVGSLLQAGSSNVEQHGNLCCSLNVHQLYISGFKLKFSAAQMD